MANRARARDDDFKIDFAKQSKDISAAIESDERYWRENDAKFRAVNQKVGSYEEFRDIVKAAHLKPLEKGDRISDMKRFNQPWNICARKGDNVNVDGTEPGTTKNEFIIPKTSLELSRDWKRQQSGDDKLSYLVNIPIDHLEKLFLNDTGFGLMGEMLTILSECETVDLQWTRELLEILSKCDRFSLSVQFLSSSEKSSCSKLFQRLKNVFTDDRIDQLMEIYDVTL